MFILRAILLRAIEEGEASAEFNTERQAENVRQRLYRYRSQVRKTEGDALALLVDDLTFSLNGKVISITYNRSNEEIANKFLESSNDDAESSKTSAADKRRNRVSRSA